MSEEKNKKGDPPQDMPQWVEWVEMHVQTSDNQGHGPDVGGEDTKTKSYFKKGFGPVAVVMVTKEEGEKLMFHVKKEE